MKFAYTRIAIPFVCFALISIFAATAIAAPGDLDPTFGTDGKVLPNVGGGTDIATAMVRQSDGRLIVVGNVGSRFITGDVRTAFGVVPYNADGTRDASFGVNGKALIGSGPIEANAVAVQADGSILIGGTFTSPSAGVASPDFGIFRLLPNGSVDLAFDVDGRVTIPIGAGVDRSTSLQIQPDGRILLGGSTLNGTNLDFSLARLNPDGSPDTTFSFDGKLTLPMGSGDDVVNSIAIANGKIVVAGSARSGTNTDFGVARFNADGSIDTTFGTNGKVLTAVGSLNDSANAVVVQVDGKIVVAGSTESAANSSNFAVVRYLANGTPDNSFSQSADNYGNNGIVKIDFGGNDLANALALDSSGRAVVAGSSNDRFAVARLLGGFSPTSAAVSFSGRVINSNGAGIVRATVTLTNSRGEATSARTSTFGYFRIDGIEAGQTVTLTVDSKRHRSSPRLIDVVDKIEDVVIVAND